MKLAALLIAVASFSSFSPAYSQMRFPTHPHFEMTPGDLCSAPDEYRYPEKISYCRRDVSSDEKWAIIHRYDNEYGYTIASRRSDFKIDHYIPLCMGGSNEPENLWPQHKSIYVMTDPIEPKLCELMSLGKLSQEDAVELIKAAKENPQSTAQIMAEIASF